LLFFDIQVCITNSFTNFEGGDTPLPLSNFQGSAAFSALAFLGLVLIEGLAVVATIALMANGLRKLAARVVVAGAAMALLYLTTLLAFSLASREQIAEQGQEKYLCELDCHLAYAVVAAREARSLGDGDSRAAPRGVFRVVTVAVRFDEDTICPRRPRDLALTPNPRRVRLVDGSGDLHAIDPAGQRALEAVGGPQVLLTRPLKPGEAYRTELVFDVPASARDLRLLVTDDLPVTRILIGHENGLLHKKVLLRVS
jgi:hypothetical protein